jgi:acetyltransferase-like isoleucine patch superfamily enzyme
LPPLYGTVPLADFHPGGYVSPRARVAHPDLTLGDHCFIGDNVLIYRDHRGSGVSLGNRVHLHESNTIQTGEGGSVAIGDETHIQPRCQISAYCGKVEIGKRVEVAPSCAFYPYNHGMEAGTPIRFQPLHSRSGIIVEDDAWLGFGVILLDGAHVGEGAVIAAGSVVNAAIPPNAIAAGTPARVIGSRSGA